MHYLKDTPKNDDGYFKINDLAKNYAKTVHNYVNNQRTNKLSRLIEASINKPAICRFHGRWDGSGTFVHPILFIDFLIWLDIETEYPLLEYIKDNLL